MQDSVRAARAAGVGVPASGWEKMPSEVWPHVAATITGEWHPGAVKFHLRWWAARERLAGVPRPGRPALAALFGWGDRRLRDFMADPQTWDDAAEPRSRKGPAKVQDGSSVGPDKVQDGSSVGPDKVQDGSSVGPDKVQDAIGSTVVLALKGPDEVQVRSSQGPDEVQTTSSRALVAETETEPKAEPKRGPPAPAVGDLFAPLASHTDADTGKATGDTTPPPGSAAPLPVKAKRERKAPDMTAELGRVLDAFATFDPVRAQKAREGKNAGVIDEATKAIRLLGADRIEARLRWVGANQSHKDVVWLLEHHGWASLFVHGKPTVNRFDDAAAMEASTPAVAADARADASAAWFDMTSRRGWKSVGARCFNQHDDFGGSTGFDLADDKPEHARRFHAFRAAGGMIGWDKAGENNGAGRAAFRERFLTAYMAGCKA